MIDRALDRERAWARGRTLRELLVLAGGAGLVAFELLRPGDPDLPNLAVYVLATLLFAVRFYPARAAAVAACVGALAQQWPHLREGLVTWETLGVVPLLGIATLASSDLVARFDRAPSRVSWLPNLWAGFTAAETRTLRWSAYAAGALAGLLDHVTELTGPLPLELAPTWPRAAMLALTASLLLLCVGRAIGLLGVWAAGLFVVVRTLPLLAGAEQVIAARTSAAAYDPAALVLAGAAAYLLPVAVLAATAVLLTTPVTLRLLRRTLLG